MEEMTLFQPAQEPTGELAIVRQIPVIEEHLELARDAIRRETDEAMQLVATPDTLASVKKTRADLNKKHDAFEQIRKEVKRQVLEQYERFEAMYRDCVEQPFRDADNSLRGKIGEVENAIKKACEDKCYAHFVELAKARGIVWLDYARLGIKVSMTDAKKKVPSNLYAQIENAVNGIANDLDAIATMENAHEVMAEYKTSLNVSMAIAAVDSRHKREEAEREAVARRAEAARIERERQEAMRQAAQAQGAVIEPLQAPVAAPVEAAPAEPLLQVTFKVTGTRAQLVAIREYMKEMGVKYE